MSDNTVFGDAFWHWVEGVNVYVIDNVSDSEDMVKKAESYVACTGNKIKEWGLSGHGDGGGVQTKNGKGINPAKFSSSQQNRMKATLAPSDGRYTNWGCASGLAPNDLQKIADLYNITARGWTGSVYPGRMRSRDDTVHGEKPTWVILNPKK